MKTRVQILALLAVLMGASLPAVVGAGPAEAATQATFYASPTGSGSGCTSISAPCSLAGAKAAAAALAGASQTGDIVINLAGGNYNLAGGPLVFSPSDSGGNGHQVIYQAEGWGTTSQQTPTLTAGVQVTGWSQVTGTNEWTATLPSGTNPDIRDAWVNGHRAYRADRGSGLPGTVTENVSGGQLLGYTTSDTSMRSWTNLASTELVYTESGGDNWTESRCDIASITGTGSSETITVKQPCLENANSIEGVTYPTDVENNAALLGKPGQFYINPTTDVMTYTPRQGENFPYASVIVGGGPTVIQGNGTLNSTNPSLDAPIQNLTFQGLTFTGTTLRQASTNDGYVSILEEGIVTTSGGAAVVSEPAATVTISTARNVTFNSDTFVHTGDAGLELNTGSQNDTVVGNTIEDTGGSGIVIGDQQQWSGTPADQQSTGHVISNNYIHSVGRIYRDSAGIYLPQTSGTTISHNDISDSYYDGITVGYGANPSDGLNPPIPSGQTATSWSTNGRTEYSKNNVISANYVHSTHELFTDGGAIYTWGEQGSSTATQTVVSDNYVSQNGDGAFSLYNDENAAYILDTNNVVTPSSGDFLLIHNNSAPVTVTNSYVDNTAYAVSTLSGAPAPSITNTVDISSGTIPQVAQTIIGNAGLQVAYQSLEPTGQTVTDDASSAITYAGTWTGDTDRVGAFDKTLHYTNSAGASATFTFTGSGVTVYGETHFDHSPVAISIDGSTAQNIYSLSPQIETQQALFQVDNLAYGTHTITLTDTTSGWITLDYFSVDSRQLVNDNGSGYTYGSGWYDQSATGLGDINNDMHASATIGSAATFTFTGSGVQYIGEENSDIGTALVYLDGNLIATVNAYSPTRLSQQVLWSAGGLPYGSHTVQIVQQSGQYATIDAMRVDTSSQVVYNDTASSITYGTGWYYSSARGFGDYGDDVHATSTIGSQLSFAFTGTRVDYIAELNSDIGNVSISLDGGTPVTVSGNTTGPRSIQQVLFSLQSLAPGAHTLTLTFTGGNTYGSVDAFRVFA